MTCQTFAMVKTHLDQYKRHRPAAARVTALTPGERRISQ